METITLTSRPRRRRGFLVLALIAALVATAVLPRNAAAQPVDLELVLAVDVSDSVDLAEARLQRDGYLAALADPGVIAAVSAGRHRRIAVTYVEWAGLGHYKIIADWAVIAGRKSAEAFAARIAAAPLTTARRTSISDAIMFSIDRFAGNGYQGARRILDISGDGPNNYGALVTKARDAAVAKGLTINGLAILPDPSEPENRGGLRQLDLYYQDCVIGGPGAFVIVAEGYASFADAIRRKLVREIAGPPARPLHRAAFERAAEDRPACSIGEWMWFGTNR